ncbi:MAG: Fe-S cluster assembly protein SufD [Candidatus Tectomicrobia bacterium]|uniref:Fe-S cluster assembly protein SufD n=1 Tax=Tectimicrobiota bacterium TaxID=2528274 RepID=A0A932M194_UNCTE|nr:Fe-S cluster assembly protein SufD [Candidatus Tectomicrobia bacterium]
MTVVTQQIDSYLESFARFENSAPGSGQGWARSIRQAAITRFSELGFPTIRDEDWRFTSVAPIAQADFKLARDGRFALSSREIGQFTFPGLACSQLVFVNGRYSPELSSLGLLPNGVTVGSLAWFLDNDPDLAEPHLARYADYQQDAFAALNTAFMEDGAFVHIPRGTVLPEPIHLLYISTAAGAPLITHPRNLILADEDSQATIVEDYVSLGSGVHFSNSVTEAVLGQNSVLSHYRLERESKEAFNISTLRFQQGRSSSLASHSVLLGGALMRNNIHPALAGEGCDCLINGLFMATGRQHMDNYMKVEHAGPHCNSRQFYHGILDGRSRGVFHGRIIVHKDAQKTDAKQTNRNLLLSENAQIDTKPQLEIYADDVKCTHGATIGQIDEDAIFYLRSRGIAEESARALLLFAFAGECLQRMKIEPIRKHLEALVTQWSPLGKLLEEAR